MLRLHGVIGRETDADLRDRLHDLEHRHAVERLFVPEADLGRRRFRLTTDKGTDCAVSLDRGDALDDGALLLLEPMRAIIVRVGAPATLRLRARSQEAALRLGWNAGNLHWRVRFEGEDLVVLLDGAAEDYRARIGPLLADGSVDEVVDGG